jgi:hypothetical protein
MSGRALAVTVATAVALLAAGSAQPHAHAAAAGPVGLMSDQAGSGLALVRVDPRNLRPVTGQSLELGGIFGWGFSPDPRLVVFSVTASNDGREDPQASLRLVDTSTLSVIHDIPLGLGLPLTVSWIAPDRLLVLLSHCCPPNRPAADLLVVDPVAQRIIERKTLPFGEAIYTHRVGGQLLVLSASGAGIGPAELTVLDQQGTVRSVRLDRIDIGSDPTGDEGTPGLAAQRDSQHAYVISPRLVAEVDLGSLTVTYHRISPAVGGSGSPGNVLWAQVLPSGKVAVVGWDSQNQNYPASGLKLIDTATWTARTVDRKADSFTVAGNLLLATVSNGIVGTRSTWTRPALTAYTLAGKRRFQLFKRQSVEVDQVYGHRAYVGWYVQKQQNLEPGPVRVVDLRTGRIVGKRDPGTLPYVLTNEDTS